MAKVVYYRGDVQGVGFRATAAWIARRHSTIRGWDAKPGRWAS
jgi:acylphosphatase